ncbi:S-type pyocin domain-containing protein [Salmonella enterica]|uniref:colicin-like bacteriocin tRNase domain-containing protein n=1 Tax=Salmonella enterica TaxID=28901 RepID=UPI0009ABD89D|nr:colicin-like bacteriocin tRNase domain-containing protein [Salmonella enterica]EJG5924631.1 S-type pyocin domain-containing protein [Salmonella enterica]ELX2839983.1 S-type pyocin domain-containing protein [Salmonella enterica]
MSDGNTAPANPGDTMIVWGNMPGWGESGAGAGLGLNPDFDPTTGNGWLPDEDGYTEALPAGVSVDVQAAINQVKDVSGSLMCADIWKLAPAMGSPWDPKTPWEPVFVYFPAQAVTSADLSAADSVPSNVPVHTRIQDNVRDGAQYICATGSSSQPYNLPVIKATPAGSSYTVGHLPGPMSPYTFSFSANAPRGELRFPRIEEKATGLHLAGFTVGTSTMDCIVVFPQGSGIEALYFSMVVSLTAGQLQQRQEAENQARAKADAEAKAKAEAEAREKAESEARAKAEREALFARAGVAPAPVYTPEMVKAAETALGATGVMTLSQAPGAMQLSVAGKGVWTATGEALIGLGAAIGRGIAALSATATASTAGPMVAAASTILFSPSAGSGSDHVPGRNLEAMFALNAQLMAGQDVKIEPGATSVNLPERGQLVSSNGQLALQLLKTGDNLPAAVPVLNAVRDAVTGLDRITVPAVSGAPERIILVNPAPPPAVPTDTASPPSVPVTPAHTGAEVKPVETITVTTTPAADTGGLQDFIYWRPDAAGTGVEPVYVMLGIYGETNATGKYSGRDYNSDKAGGPIQDLDWKTATIDRTGVDKVKLHTGRFGYSPENKVMIDRLEKILKGELQTTDTDKRFYTHEVRELERYQALGIADGTVPENDYEVWNNTHTATLEDYKLSSDETLLYTPEALNSQN